MRKIFTLCFFFTACYSNSQSGIPYSSCYPPKIPGTPADELKPMVPNLTNGLTGKVKGLHIYTQKDDTVRKGTTIRFSCRRTFTGDSLPVLIVDGVPTGLKFLSEINPNQIKSVEILKPAQASAILGIQGVNGAIFIETKKSFERKFIIKDFLDGSPIAGATVSFISADKRDSLMFVANDSGVVITDKLKKTSKYEMTVSAIGNLTSNTVFENSYSAVTKEVLLSRETKTCLEVVVTCFDCARTIRCGNGFKVMRKREVTEDKQEAATFKVFPNPISKGGTLNIKFKVYGTEKKSIRVISLDGRQLSTVSVNTDKLQGNFQIQTDARWPAGIYFVQLLYENGRVAASEKIIIQ